MSANLEEYLSSFSSLAFAKASSWPQRNNDRPNFRLWLKFTRSGMRHPGESFIFFCSVILSPMQGCRDGFHEDTVVPLFH